MSFNAINARFYLKKSHVMICNAISLYNNLQQILKIRQSIIMPESQNKNLQEHILDKLHNKQPQKK